MKNITFQQCNKESEVICQSAFPKRIPQSRRNECSFRSTISTDRIKNIMTGEAYVDSNHNLENFVKSIQEIDNQTTMVMIYLNFTPYSFYTQHHLSSLPELFSWLAEINLILFEDHSN